MGHAKSPLSGVVKFVDDCADEVTPRSGIATTSSGILKTQTHGINEKSDVIAPTVLQTFPLRKVTLTRTINNKY